MEKYQFTYRKMYIYLPQHIFVNLKPNQLI